MYMGLHVKYPSFLSDVNEYRIFWPDLRKNTRISNLMKIRPVGAELFHRDEQTDRQTDMTKLRDVFRNFANVPENWRHNWNVHSSAASKYVNRKAYVK